MSAMNNGQSGPPPLTLVAAPAMPVNRKRITLDGIYAGFWADMRLNPRRSMLDGLGSGETRPACEAISKLVMDWNVTDEDGQPVANTPDAVYDLPDDMLGQVIRKYLDAVREASDIPKPPAAPSATG